ncbi:MAG: diaminopimelate decarboxylase [Candidatus Thermoplasmatota archaeon]|nr:diaminopimelate decarboxylase [Candidatus Thermoplasmatota archaeon]
MLPTTIENRNGIMFIDGVSSLDLAKRFDTPLYVVSEKRIRQNYRNVFSNLKQNYQKIRINYSAKANTNISVLKILESEGANLDVVSPGEAFLALKSGFSPERIIFTGTNARDDELKYLIESKVLINADSLSMLERILKIKTPDTISFRINPMIGAGHHEHCITAGKDSKFGIWEDDALAAYKRALDAGVKKFGIHMHIGSGIMNAQPFLLALEKLLEIAGKIRKTLGIKFDFIDIGGGIGVPYRLGEKEIDLAEFSNLILGAFNKGVKDNDLGEPFFCVEPGRYIICDSCVLLTAVNTVKENPNKKFIGVDAGFNVLVRPAMYGSYHHVLVANRMNAPEEQECDVAGPLCESGDLLAKNRKLPKIQEGDVLAVLNAGAYGFSMSSNYNSRQRPAEVLVNEGKCAIVRERETMDNLLLHQKTARWLK